MGRIRKPEEYSRRILVSVTGLSPQVITETLYALVVQKRTPFIPTEIHLLTTREGAERASLALLDPRKGRFHAFCQDYNLEGRVLFGAEQIHVVEDESGKPLRDIRSVDDNRRADLFTNV